jgi:hypothetical protein
MMRVKRRSMVARRSSVLGSLLMAGEFTGLLAGKLHAQAATGKLQVRVQDPAGVPVAAGRRSPGPRQAILARHALVPVPPLRTVRLTVPAPASTLARRVPSR